MPDFLLPDLGEGLTEADILSWSVSVGDTVTIDQIVVEVETAKAAVEVPIPFAGVVSALHASAGDTVAVGTPLISVTASEHSLEAVGFQEPGVVMADGPVPTDAEHGTFDSNTSGSDADGALAESSGHVLIGYGTSASTGRRHRQGRRSLKAPVSSTSEVGPATAAASAVTPTENATAPAVISPLVRKAARNARVDIAAVRGSGRGGMILRSDVERAITDATSTDDAASSDVAASTAAEQASPAERQPDVTAPAPSDGEPRRIPIKGLRKVVVDKLSRSRREIPEATVWVDVDATPLMAARAQLNARDPLRPVSVLAMLARFTTAGLGLFPELNSRVVGEEIIIEPSVHLGFAAQTERGLVVPVVDNAHRLSTRALSAAMGALTASARAGTLAPSELTGGTFTVNNYGVFGVDGSAAIINYPEAAILGVGRIVDKPWVLEGELAVRKVTQLTLAFDHRVCDGGTAGGFLRFIADCVEAPTVALGEL